MIYSLFGSNRPQVFGLLIIPAIAYGVLAFLWGQVPDQPLGGPLFDLLYAFLNSPFLLIISGLTINLLGAFLINHLYNAHNYAERVSYFPALIYFLFASSQISWMFLNPVLISNIFVLLALRRMLTMYRVQEITSMIYDAGVFLATGALFFPLLAVVFPLLWISLIQLRTFNLREWIVPLIGLLTPTAFTVGVFWWFDYELDISEFISFSEFPLHTLFTSHGFLYLPVVILSLFILIVGLIIFIRDMNISTVHKQNTKKVFLSTSIFLVIMCLYGLGLESNQLGMLSILAIPASVYTGVYFTRNKPKTVIVILFYIWILLLLFYPVLAIRM